MVFTDGSAVLEDDLGWVGGFGAFLGDHDDFLAPLPLTKPQTNNRAELRALARVLQIITLKPDPTRWAIAMESVLCRQGSKWCGELMEGQ